MPHGGKRMPLSPSSDKTKRCAKLSCREIAKVLGWETSGPLMVFSSQTYISSLKLGLMLSTREPRLSPRQRSGARSRQDIYCFHFVLRQQLIAYCVPLLLPPTGANLFRLNCTVVSLMPFGEKKKKGKKTPSYILRLGEERNITKRLFYEAAEKWSITKLIPNDEEKSSDCCSLEVFGRIVWPHHQAQFFSLTIYYAPIIIQRTTCPFANT